MPTSQTRAFIHIQDTVRCIQIALENPPRSGERVQIFNQMTETHRVRDLAQMIAERTGAKSTTCPTRAMRRTRTTCTSKTTVSRVSAWSPSPWAMG